MKAVHRDTGAICDIEVIEHYYAPDCRGFRYRTDIAEVVMNASAFENTFNTRLTKYFDYLDDLRAKDMRVTPGNLVDEFDMIPGEARSIFTQWRGCYENTINQNWK